MEETLIKKLLIGILVVMGINLLHQVIFIPRNIKNSLENIKAVQKDLDKAREELSEAREQSNMLLGELETQTKFLNDIHAGVEILELERRQSKERFKTKKDSLNREIKKFLDRKDSTIIKVIEIID